MTWQVLRSDRNPVSNLGMTSSFRRHFVLPDDIIYLNAAYMTPLPVAAGQVGVAAIEKRTAGVWTTTASDFFEPSERLRAIVASLWGVIPRNVALVPSVSYGVETMVKNIHLDAGADILVPQDDFPSGIYPWADAANRARAQMVVVPRPNDFNWTQAVLNQLDRSVRAGRKVAVVSIPYSDWSDGTCFDLRVISAACQAVGACLAVDLSQSFGAVPVAISEFEPDFLFSVGYKWQLGPYGLSYLYVADKWLGGVPMENGWLNRRGSDDFARLVEYQHEYQDGARRFDSGQRSQFQLTPMAIESLGLLREISIPAIFAHGNELVGLLHDQLSVLGFEVPPLHLLAGHMIGVRHKNWPDMAPLVKRLRERSIFVSARGSALRIAPHLYNTKEEIERFIIALAIDSGLAD